MVFGIHGNQEQVTAATASLLFLGYTSDGIFSSIMLNGLEMLISSLKYFVVDILPLCRMVSSRI